MDKLKAVRKFLGENLQVELSSFSEDCFVEGTREPTNLYLVLTPEEIKHYLDSQGNLIYGLNEVFGGLMDRLDDEVSLINKDIELTATVYRNGMLGKIVSIEASNGDEALEKIEEKLGEGFYWDRYWNGGLVTGVPLEKVCNDEIKVIVKESSEDDESRLDTLAVFEATGLNPEHFN